LERDALGLRGGEERVADATTEHVEARVRVQRLQLTDCGEAGGHGERVTRERAGLIDRAERRESVHDLDLAAEGADRETATDDLAHADEIRDDIMQALRSREGKTEPRHHFVEDKHRAVLRAEFAETGEETGVGQDQADIGRERLDNESGDLTGIGVEERGQSGEIIVFGDERVGGSAGRDASGIGITLRERAGAGLHEERIDVAVVTARELDDLVTTRVTAGEADGRHRGFGAAVGHADLLHRRHAGQNQFGHLDLEGIRGAEARAAVEGLTDRRADIRVVVAVDGRTPGQDEVHELLVIGRGQTSAIGRLREEGGATDRAESADRGIDAARDHREGALEKLLRGIHEPIR
jgi:hypothetical protein